MKILLIFWCINTFKIATCNEQPLEWSRYAEPSYHSIFTSDQNSLSLFLSEAPIVRVKSSEHKLELFKNVQVVDISKVSLSSHNLKRSVSLMRKQELVFQSPFHQMDGSNIEIMMIENIGFHQCQSRCQMEDSAMFADIFHLKDILSVFGQNQELDISRIWIQNKQREHKKYSYSARYELDILVNNSTVSLLPQNKITTFGTVNCLAFHIDDWVADNCMDIGAKTSYWQKILGAEKYWSQQFFKLNVQIVLDNSFLINKQTNRTNITSDFEWQLNYANFRVLVPVSRDVQLSPLQKATCICQRNNQKSELRKLRAQSVISEISLNNRNLLLGIETQRIRKESTSDLSSVSVLLDDLQNIRARPPVPYYLNQSMIYPLSINSSDSALLFNTKLNDSFGTLMSNLGHNQRRQKRALPGLLLGSLKILSLGLPYLLEDSVSVIGDLVSEIKAKVIVPQFSHQNQMSSEAFADMLSAKFSDDIQFSILDDRISVDFQASPHLLFNVSQGVDDRLLAEFSASSEKLVFFQDKILKILPQLLLRRLLPEIEHKLRPGGQIFHHITLSKSFIVCEFFWEQIVPNSKVTTYRFWSLPADQVDHTFESYDVQNLTISLDRELELSAKTNEIFRCQQRVITAVALSIDNYCPKKRMDITRAHIGLLWLNASIILVQGPSTLHYSCSEGTNRIVSLEKQFNLFIVHDFCTLHVQFSDGLTFSKQMIPTAYHQNFGLLHLLQYDIYQMTPKYQITQLWLISLTICLAITAMLLVAVLFYFCYYKTKIGLRIWRTLTGDDSFPPDTRIEFVNQRPSQEGESYISMEKDSSVSPTRQLPKEGGRRGEQVLQQAFRNQHLRAQSCEKCFKESRLDSFSHLPELHQISDRNPTMEYIFPHMYDTSIDSGMNSGSIQQQKMSTLHLSLQTPQFGSDGNIITQKMSSERPSIPIVPASHLRI